MTQLGREGRLRQNPSFEKETAKLIEVLGNDGTRQPVIIDETGNYRDIVVEQLAIGIAAGNVPDALKDKTILKLETPVVFSNARSNAEATTLVNTVLDKALAAKGRTILFVDELTQFSARSVRMQNFAKRSKRTGFRSSVAATRPISHSISKARKL